MRIIKEIAGRIFAFWTLLVFGVTLLVIALFVWITGVVKEPRRTEIFRRVSRVWIRTFFILTGCWLKVKGTANFKAGQNYIVVCNHNSFIDVPIVTPFIPGPNKTIAKIELSRIPVFGLVYKRGSILVDRKSAASRKESFKQMKKVLSMGMHMCIYPEGTRNKTAAPLKSFHDGAFKLAIETKKPILPALIFNTRRALPPEKTFYFRPSRFEIHFLPPVPVENADTVESLKQSIFALMSSYYSLHTPL